MSALCVFQSRLCKGPDIIFGILFWHVPPTPPTHSGPPPWGPRKPGTRLTLSASAGQLGSGGAPYSFAVCWQPPFSCPHLSYFCLFTSSQLQNTIQRRPVLCSAVNTDTHSWEYTHIHTFRCHWKRQEQRRKEEQTPLRCWAWLGVPLDTDGRTQDNCCLLFMEGPSATLHALFIWRLLKGHSQEPQEESRVELTVSTVCVAHSVCMCMLHCLHAQSELTLMKLSLY